MASTIFDGSTSTSTTYSSSDIYTLGVPTSQITNVSQQGSDVVISTATATLTIAGVTLAQLTSGNFALQGGGTFVAGDNLASATNDQFGNTVTGTANNDILLGLGGADTINAGNGDNLVFGGSAVTDTADGGDQITTGTGNDTIYGNAGADTIVSGGGQDIVYGGIGADNITTGSLTGTVSVYGGGGFTDTVDGGDTIIVAGNTGSLFLTGNAGDDTLTVTSSGSASVYGGIGADNITLTASAGDNLIAGGSSAGSTDVDTISFTATGDANVTIYGGVGVTDANDGVDNITATGLTANSTAEIYGNSGNDDIDLSTAGAASVYGGVGSDTIDVTATGADARIVVYAGPSETGTAETVTVTGFAGAQVTVYGGTGLDDSVDGADSLVGGISDDTIYGNGGNDTIVSGAGNDSLIGGAGDDLFRVNGLGTKTIADFGTGNDTLLLNSTQAALITSVNSAGNVIQLTDGSTFTLNINGTFPSPTLTGRIDATNDGLTASDGNLIIQTSTDALNVSGTARADLIIGNNGADAILSGGGNDNVFGGAGNDTITGGTGVDVLHGGAGTDTFVFSAGDSGAPAFNNFDTISDFASASDVIDYSSALTIVSGSTGAGVGVASISAGGVASFNAADDTTAERIIAAEAAINSNGAAAAGQAVIFQGGGADSVNSYLFISDGVDGVGANDVLIQLTGVNTASTAFDTLTINGDGNATLA